MGCALCIRPSMLPRSRWRAFASVVGANAKDRRYEQLQQRYQDGENGTRWRKDDIDQNPCLRAVLNDDADDEYGRYDEVREWFEIVIGPVEQASQSRRQGPDVIGREDRHKRHGKNDDDDTEALDDETVDSDQLDHHLYWKRQPLGRHPAEVRDDG